LTGHNALILGLREISRVWAYNPLSVDRFSTA
jgi:hypothetical protein